MPMRLERFGCLRRCASSSWRRAGSIRPRRLSFTARCLETPQRETTPFYPRSPYGVAKLYAYWITVNYREAYGLFASNGILFNHESPFAGRLSSPARLHAPSRRSSVGLQDTLYIGNLDAKRDWGHAKDFVRGMWLMLQQPKPDDYVLATGESHSVREFIELAFAQVGRRSRGREAAKMKLASTAMGKSSSKSTDATSGQQKSTSSLATQQSEKGTRLGGRNEFH